MFLTTALLNRIFKKYTDKINKSFRTARKQYKLTTKQTKLFYFLSLI